MREKLKKALSNLDRVSKIPLEELKVKDGQLIFSPRLFSPFRPVDPSVIEALNISLKMVKTQIIKIKAMEAGTKEEQKLAKEAVSIIERFNAVIQKRQAASFKTKLSSFLFSPQEFAFHPIPFPRHIHQAPKPQAEKVEKTFWTQIQPIDLRAQDLFFMKALTLVQEFIPTRQEAFKFIKESPLKSSFDPKDSLLWMNQEILFWPGITLSLKGAFQRDPQTGIFSIPVLQTFESSYFTRCCFPFPQEYTGASLAYPLIPLYPHHLEKLPLVNDALRKKELLAQELNPKGALVPQLLKLIDKKNQSVEANKEEWINLQKEFVLTLIKASPACSQEEMEPVHAFFTALKEHSFPFKVLSKAFFDFNQAFLVAPFQNLQEAWIKESLPKDQRSCQTAAVLLLAPQFQETSENDLQKAFVKLLGKACLPAFQEIILLYLAESLPMTQEALKPFSEKIQAWGFRQQFSFFEELENPSLECWEMMKRHIQEDIDLFSAPNAQDPVVFELRRYFATYENSFQ